MRLVWLSHFVPYPPRGGSYQRTFNLLRHISRKYETTFIALNLEKESASKLAEYRDEFSKFCAAVEFWETPIKGKGVRWWAQLGLGPLDSLHHAARSLWSPHLDTRWRTLLEKHRGDLVQFETIDLAPYISGSNGFRRALTHQNCESAMAKRRAENETNPVKKAYLFNQAQKIERQEHYWCPRFDVNLAVSGLDAERLRTQCGVIHLHVVENGTDTEYFTPAAGQTEPNAIVFAASLRWYPNVSGIRFFTTRIWPLLKARCPGIRLYLAGRNPSPAIIQIAAADPDIQLIADPPDIRPWVARGSVFICPIIDGGGTRLKILDALAMGMPVLTTRLGCEGLQVEPGKNIVVADSPEEFASAAQSLLGNAALRQQLRTEGRKLVEEVYSWNAIVRRLEDAYECAMGPESERPVRGTCYSPGASGHGLRG